MRTIARLAQIEDRAPGDHLPAVPHESLDHLLQRQQAGLGIDQSDEIDAEHALHLGVPVEVVQHHVGHRAPAQLDHHAHAVLVGLVAQLGDALYPLLLDQLRDLLQQARLVDLVGQLGDRDARADAVLAPFDVSAGAHVDAASPGLVGLANPPRAVDDPGGGKVRTGHVLHQLGQLDAGVLDAGHAGVDDLSEIVGRDVGGHADRDARRPVDEQVGQPRREDRGLAFGVVVVGHEVDRVAVEIGEHLVGDAGEAHLRVAHRGRRVPVHRPEVPLAVHQHVSHREGLGKTHQRLVDGLVAVRMVLAGGVAADPRGLLEGAVPVEIELLHRVQDPPVDGLESVAHIGERPTHDYAHGVVEVGLLHLLLDVDGEDFLCELAHGLFP